MTALFPSPARFIASILLFLTAWPAWAATGDALEVTAFGAVGDGLTLNTAALQKAIDACSAQGGGKVVFPAGRFLTGTIELKDNVTLQLGPDTVLLGSLNAADYRNVDPFVAGDGIPLGHALVVALGAHHVGLEGGAIDGQGKAVKAGQNPYRVRPFLVRWIRCTDVTVKNLELRHSGAWGMHFFQSKKVEVQGVTIRSRGLMNNDGIDIDSCEMVRIKGCDIDSGDDAICLKATSALPCRDVIATDCKLKTSCNAIKLGTESLGDFEQIQVKRCEVRDIGMAGIAIYSVDGAQTHDVTISEITMDGVTVPISLRLGARLKTFRAGDQAKTPGQLRDITLKNITAVRARQIGLLINGIPDHRIERLRLENIQIEVLGGGKAEDAQVQLPEKEAAYPEMNMFGKVMPSYGLYLRHVRGVQFKNVKLSAVSADGRPEKVLVDAEDITPPDFAATK